MKQDLKTNQLNNQSNEEPENNDRSGRRVTKAERYNGDFLFNMQIYAPNV